MKTHIHFKSELDLPPTLTSWVLVALGTAMLVVSEVLPTTVRRRQYFVFCILAYLIAAFLWLLSGKLPRISRPTAVGLLLTAVYLGAYKMDMPALLSLTGTATVLAAALIGLPAAVGTAVVEMIILVLLSRLNIPGVGTPLINQGTLIIRLVAVVITLGLIYAVYHRIYGLSEWLWEYFNHAQRDQEEMRDRKANLEHALDDLVHANRQLALANERMALLRTIAEDAQKAKATFVANVSHEFRTPLNMIIGLVTLMIESPEIYAIDLSPDIRNDLQIVFRNCNLLAQMVNDVLNLTQMETGRLVLHRERFDLRETIISAVSVVSPLLEKKQLTLRQEIPSDLPLVFCDRTRIQQVILNLVSNAARFTDKGGITISAELHTERITVSVSDTGPGILPEDRERIFEPFCQGVAELWRDTGGSGLGLTISKQFIELHGGRIWLESEFGLGTTFHFDLPISEPVAHIARPDRYIQKDWIWHERRNQTLFSDDHYQPRIVICDASGDLYTEFTRRSDKIDFVDTRNINQALEDLQASSAHALVINEPISTDLVQLVESTSKIVPTTPIIGCSVPSVTIRLANSGATGYLIKPVARIDFERIIKALAKPVKNVLLIDDDADVLQLYTRTLHVYDPTLTITSVSSGHSAIAMLRSVNSDKLPDLVLLDVYMPDIDGWQVLEQLRMEKRTEELPVYLVSAHDPVDRPPGNKLFLGAMGEEFSINKLLHCSMLFSELLLTPEGALDPEPVQVAEVKSA